jgi:mannose-6-phosphate isomerase-like protein (cupin superfamily)
VNRPRPVSRTTAPHYVWGDVSDGWRLVDEPELAVTEERVPPGAGEQPHRHLTARQFFYLLEGRAELRTTRGTVEVAAGEGVEIPPGLVHQFVNPGPVDARFIVVSAPTTRGDRQPTDLPQEPRRC